MKRLPLVLICLACITSICKVHSQQGVYTKYIPSLESLSGFWMNADTTAIEPSVRNFRAQALCNRDMTSLSWFASAPFSGGYHTGVLKLNHQVLTAQAWRWYPWQALRKTSADGALVNSTVRMLPENDLVIWEITIKNTSAAKKHFEAEQDLIGFISNYRHEEWPWPYPYPTLKGKLNERTNEIVNVRNNIGLKQGEYQITTAEISAKHSQHALAETFPSDSEILASGKYKIVERHSSGFITGDHETSCFTGFDLIDRPTKLVTKNSGGPAYWIFDLLPNESKKIRFIMSFASSKTKLKTQLANWSHQFDKIYSGIPATWAKKWQQIFTPHNKLLSACFPTLQTKDSAINKVYYTGPLTMLYLLHTNLPAHKRVYLTGGPRWGASVTFYWDLTEWSGLWAVVDPTMMKEQLISWIHIDPSKYFGQDNFSGKGVGNGYVANYWALFQLIRSYITTTNDYTFLSTKIDQKTVLEHLTAYAYNWKKISLFGKPGSTEDIYKLADFGDDPWNLLECVPTYIHIVPSFNAGYVWMMRETAKFQNYAGNKAKASTMITEADSMAKRILGLYAGNGYWNSLYPDNKKVEIRHVLDFMFIGKFMHNDLPDSIKKAMTEFAYRELITDHWMRAQSLDDIAARNSDRPDHGPLGAFDGWPPGTMDALSALGHTDSAFLFYQHIAPVTYEGCWAQAHELWGADKLNKNALVRIPERGWNNRESSAGIDFSQVLLKNFLGFYPQIDGTVMQNNQQGFSINCNLWNVYFKGSYHTIHSNNGTVTISGLP